MKKLRTWPAQMLPRKWQQRALRKLYRSNKKDFLVVATPGSGKTLLALRYAHQMLDDALVERVVVVTATESLKGQWAAAAARVGIDLDSRWSNADGVEAADFHGVAVTYQQVSFAPDLYRLNCRRRTLVGFDELHHAGDSLDWGVKLREAFGPAAHRLALSGTPFRSDNHPIPFVEYVAGKSKADYEYGYGEGLADGVCRPIYFPSVEGPIRWLSGDGSEMDCSLLDSLARQKAAERLRAALDPRGNWRRGVLKAANDKLTAMRVDGHRDAAGLVIAIDQEHAKRIAELLRETTGEAPAIAISDDPAAGDIIRRFAANGARWIVAVKMISEGVDIPRLRVGVYATNVTSELFFRQAVGRFVRVIAGLDEQSASLFIPADATLVRFALAIKEERDHQLREEIERTTAGEGNTSGDRTDSTFMPLSSEARPHDVIFDGGSFNQAELEFAETVRRAVGACLPAAQVAAILRHGAAAQEVFVRHTMHDAEAYAAPDAPTKVERKRALRRTTQRLANQLAHLLGVEPREVHSRWIKRSGRAQHQATEEELENKQRWLIERKVITPASNSALMCAPSTMLQRQVTLPPSKRNQALSVYVCA